MSDGFADSEYKVSAYPQEVVLGDLELLKRKIAQTEQLALDRRKARAPAPVVEPEQETQPPWEIISVSMTEPPGEDPIGDLPEIPLQTWWGYGPRRARASTKDSISHATTGGRPPWEGGKKA